MNRRFGSRSCSGLRREKRRHDPAQQPGRTRQAPGPWRREGGEGGVPAKGDGITKRKDGRYMARHTVQTSDGPKRKTIYGRKYKEVERRLAEAMGDAAKGIVFDSDNLKLGDWLDSWLDDLLKPLVDAGKMARSTYLRYEGIANNHLKPALGHRKLKDLTRAEVRRLYNQKGKELSPPLGRLH